MTSRRPLELLSVSNHTGVPPCSRSNSKGDDLSGLPVPEVAGYLGRSVRATQTLLARARSALRRIYQEDARGDT